MSLTVLLGGARSGKSRLAVELALESGLSVTFVATGEARDPEMEERIARHRAERPETWHTLEEPLDLETALLEVEPDRLVVVDCLSLWVANLLGRGDEPDTVLTSAARSAALAAERPSPTIAVTNEVGLGIVPAAPLGRAYRDLLGSVNRIWVADSTTAALVVAGRALSLSGAHDLLAPEVAGR